LLINYWDNEQSFININSHLCGHTRKCQAKYLVFIETLDRRRSVRCDALSFFNLNLAPVTQFLSLSAVYVRLAYTLLTLIEAICGLNLFLCSIFISLIFPLLFFCTNQFQFPFFSYFICAIKSGCTGVLKLIKYTPAIALYLYMYL